VPGQLSHPNHPTHGGTAVDGWHELSVANPTFLLERLGSECTDLQGLRQLTVNGIDAIAALGERAAGRVVWDLDWLRFDASAGRVRKLSVTDTGTGMTPEQLRRYINQLASSGREQSAAGNFGVGAKIAAGSRNPHGLEYRSWCQDQGALVCFKRHSDARWGLEPQRWKDGHTDYWRPLGEADKPPALRGRAGACCSASMSGTTQQRRRTASATVGGTGSRATSTAASCGFPLRSKCWCASNTAPSPHNCDGSTVSSTTWSGTPSRRAPWS
jgi:hypothetical protein